MLPVECGTGGAGTKGTLSDPSIKHVWSSEDRSSSSLDILGSSVVVVVVVVVAPFGLLFFGRNLSSVKQSLENKN